MARKILQTFSPFTYLIIFLLFNYSMPNCVDGRHSPDVTITGFEHAVATWYGEPEGPGSGGGCGFEDDVAFYPFNGMISAGNQYLYQYGFGCGSCYQVKCTNNDHCSGSPITVTITDECPGACNDDPIHFDLSGIAFGALAKPGEADALRKFGRIDIEFKRVSCKYNGVNMTFKVDEGSNPNYFACAIEYVSSDGTIGYAELKPSGFKEWLPMQHSWGATWKFDVYPGETRPPFSIRVTTRESGKVFTANDVIPIDWKPDEHYQ